MLYQFGPISAATEVIAQTSEPEKIIRPDASMQREWLSYILLVGIGGALYPQAIQRMYSAKSIGTL